MNEKIQKRLLSCSVKYNVDYETVSNCYSLIANRYCNLFSKKLGETFDKESNSIEYCYNVGMVSITGRQFDDLNPCKRVNAKVIRPNYRNAIDALKNDGIIIVNEHYSNFDDNKFSKSYSLHNEFVADCLLNSKSEMVNIYELLNGYLPNKYVKKLVKQAKAIYEQVKDFEYDSLKLNMDKSYLDNFDEFGYSKEDGQISIEHIILGFNCLIDKKYNHADNYVDGRNYNWIARMPKKFRKFLGLYELCDINASVLVMLTKLGKDNKKIDARENELIMKCLKDGNDIYNMVNMNVVNGKPIFEERDQIKTAVMLMTFGNIRQINGLINFYHHEKMKEFKNNFSALFPTLSNLLSKYGYQKGKIIKDGSLLFKDMSFVEKNIIENTQKKLNIKSWRVHDAIWTNVEFDKAKAKKILLSNFK